VIDIRSLTKSYGFVDVVKDLCFTAPAGAVTGFLGPNGAGKTTTLRCLLGLASPSGGRALIDGRAYRDLDSPRRVVGAMLESTGFHPARTGRDHLRVVARAARLDVSRIDLMLDVAGLTGAMHRPVGRYSLGMRQRLGLATALLGDPAVVVLDEPANGLDPAGVTWVRRLLRVCADEGRTVLVSSHVLAEVAQVVDRVVIIRDGALVTETNVGDLSAARVMVRVDRLAVFVEALRARCVEFELLDGDVISVSIADPAEVGRLAAEAGVVVIELGRRNAGASLEAMFLAATGGAR